MKSRLLGRALVLGAIIGVLSGPELFVSSAKADSSSPQAASRCPAWSVCVWERSNFTGPMSYFRSDRYTHVPVNFAHDGPDRHPRAFYNNTGTTMWLYSASGLYCYNPGRKVWTNGPSTIYAMMIKLNATTSDGKCLPPQI